jgi:DNA-binding protein Fis
VAAIQYTLAEMERRHIEFVLEQAMTLEEAAEMLGINVATLMAQAPPLWAVQKGRRR